MGKTSFISRERAKKPLEQNNGRGQDVAKNKKCWLLTTNSGLKNQVEAKLHLVDRPRWLINEIPGTWISRQKLGTSFLGANRSLDQKIFFRFLGPNFFFHVPNPRSYDLFRLTDGVARTYSTLRPSSLRPLPRESNSRLQSCTFSRDLILGCSTD